MGRYLFFVTAAGLAEAVLPQMALAQGVPVDTGSHLPVGLWAVFIIALGVVLAYGILRNRKRSAAEKSCNRAGNSRSVCSTGSRRWIGECHTPDMPTIALRACRLWDAAGRPDG